MAKSSDMIIDIALPAAIVAAGGIYIFGFFLMGKAIRNSRNDRILNNLERIGAFDECGDCPVLFWDEENEEFIWRGRKE